MKMIFKDKLTPATLIRRYKRFLADVTLESGEEITVHCPNSGSMKTCATPGWQVLLSKSDNPKRKYAYTWEMVYNNRCWIGINTGIPNIITAEAIANNKIADLKGFPVLRREVKYGRNSRIDILLESKSKKCFIEVKNVTLVESEDIYYFPDAVTERGRKHLHELAEMVRQGHRAVMFFVIQRSDGRILSPADHIDPAYGESLRKVYQSGVEIMAYRADVQPERIELAGSVPIRL
jgi:sugar fermentation stimulation protein A